DAAGTSSLAPADHCNGSLKLFYSWGFLSILFGTGERLAKGRSKRREERKFHRNYDFGADLSYGADECRSYFASPRNTGQCGNGYGQSFGAAIWQLGYRHFYVGAVRGIFLLNHWQCHYWRNTIRRCALVGKRPEQQVCQGSDHASHRDRGSCCYRVRATAFGIDRIRTGNYDFRRSLHRFWNAL